MTCFTFSYVSSDTPDRTFQSSFNCETMREALNKFYDFCTTNDTLTILDISEDAEVADYSDYDPIEPNWDMVSRHNMIVTGKPCPS